MSGTILCFGELLLRLTAPGRELLFQSGTLDARFAGAEANVAVALSNLGHSTALVSRVPDNVVGRAAIEHLRRYGVGTKSVTFAPGRMGVYYLSQGAGPRPSAIVYDRQYSSFALAGAGDFDWDRLLQGAQLFHLSGVTPALGPRSAELAIEAAKAARSKGVKLSFDGNYRSQLWESWDSDPRSILSELVATADYFFGNHRDISLLLGRTFSGEGETRRREAAVALLDEFPNVELIASTARHIEDSDRHRLEARIDTREQAYATGEVLVSGIVDRIGAGDAFAAGVLHGLLSGSGPEVAVRSGLALTSLKHSIPGDSSLFTQADIEGFFSGQKDVRR